MTLHLAFINRPFVLFANRNSKNPKIKERIFLLHVRIENITKKRRGNFPPESRVPLTIFREDPT
jgi:hypothetical protein